MSLYKNVASQKLAVFAWNALADAPKTGDAANITAQISKDGGAAAATNDLNPTELDATNHKGIYIFDMAQAETNADMIVVSPVSATAGVVIDPQMVFTFVPVAADIASILEDTGTTLNTLVLDLPTNSELAAALASADDAVLTAVADVPTVAEFEARTLVAASYATAANLATVDGIVDDILVDTGTTLNTLILDLPTNSELTTALADLPTNSELATALAGADDAVLAAVADVPTVAEFEARTIAAASYATATALDAVDNFLDTEVAAILADTNELQTDWVNGGRLDLLIDAIKAKTDNLPTDPADDSDIDAQLATIAGYLDTEIAAILADTNELQTNQGNWLTADVSGLATAAALATVDGIVDTILVDTNELQTDDVPGLIAALNDLSEAQVLAQAAAALASYDAPTAAEMSAAFSALNDLSAAEVNAEVDAAFATQMADSVPADGVIATREQALYMLIQFLTERSVAGTTVTVSKVDGSTSLMTFTLNDDTEPTSITRAS